MTAEVAKEADAKVADIKEAGGQDASSAATLKG